jgi:hypothetical protein
LTNRSRSARPEISLFDHSLSNLGQDPITIIGSFYSASITWLTMCQYIDTLV